MSDAFIDEWVARFGFLASANDPRGINMLKPTWTTAWPEEVGWFWLYARVWGDKEPMLYPVSARSAPRRSNSAKWRFRGPT